MAADPERQMNIVRIHGAPEDWLRDFLREKLALFAGKIYGAAIHLEITCEEEPEASYCITYWSWPSAAQLQGRLATTVVQLGLRHLGLPERPE